MSDPSRANPDPASRFFANYLKLLRKHAIPEKQLRWYVKHAEGFIKAQNGRKIKTLSAADINDYFGVIGRQNRLPGWQFRQHIAAIKILYCDLLGGTAGHEVDWQYWDDSARELDVEHPKVSRVRTQIPLILATSVF